MKKPILILFAMALTCQGFAETIRSFDLEIIESLGKQIYHQDILAAEATDIVLAQRIDHANYPVRGWIVDEVKGESIVTFVADYDGDLKGVFEVRKKGKRKARFRILEDQFLSEAQISQFRARTLALENIDQPCSDRYNFVVLPNRGDDGFLVYALAATADPDPVLVGGHYRMTISSDGRTMQQKDKLFRSCLVLSKNPPDMPKGAKLEALYMSHIVSDTPVEIHVYLSMLHKMTFFVMTGDNIVWTVGNDGIQKTKG